jgi:hypothetical protein
LLSALKNDTVVEAALALIAVDFAGALPVDPCARDRQEIIVVASLLDKAPNLAGLSRTCEVRRRAQSDF